MEQDRYKVIEFCNPRIEEIQTKLRGINIFSMIFLNIYSFSISNFSVTRLLKTWDLSVDVFITILLSKLSIDSTINFVPNLRFLWLRNFKSSSEESAIAASITVSSGAHSLKRKDQNKVPD